MKAKAKKRFFIQTFGCQMNVNDSEKVAGLLESRGYEAASDAHTADFVFLNTCAVREKASLKFRQSLVRLGHMKKGRPELRIGVGGCVAQLEGPAVIDGSPQVDVVVGTHTLRRIPELLDQAAESGRVAIDLDRGADAFDVPDAVTAHANPVRAYVTAMEGCNLVCSFCVVPRTRGPEVNRPPDDIVAEVEAVVARGFPEVMLLGQTVNAYRSNGHDFADLLARVDTVKGLRRLRFTTSHPSHVTPRMADAFRDLRRVCPYLHLPVQSGSDRVLKSMRRGYTRGQYLEVNGAACALTGYRCVTVDAGSIVDAAHIHQFADSRNNHPQNGIALCKNAHWLFDQGLWSVTDDYRVIVASGRFHESGNDALLLGRTAGKRIHLPADRDYWPDKGYLAWHRERKLRHS